MRTNPIESIEFMDDMDDVDNPGGARMTVDERRQGA
jgi:hypothetical protein